MNEPKRRSAFWSTLPGLLTGIAAVITAAGTLIAVVPQLAGTAAGGSMSAVAAQPARTTATVPTRQPAAGTPTSADTPAGVCAWLRDVEARPVQRGAAPSVDSETANLKALLAARSESLDRLREALRARDQAAARAELERLKGLGVATTRFCD